MVGGGGGRGDRHMRVRISHTVIIIITPRPPAVIRNISITMSQSGCVLWQSVGFKTIRYARRCRISDSGGRYRLDTLLWVCVEFWYLKGSRCPITSCQTKYWLLPGSAVCPEAKYKVDFGRVKVDSGIRLPMVNVLE
jgi:hypothetical protein